MTKISLLEVFQFPDKKKRKYLELKENLRHCYKKNLYVDAVLKVQDKIFRVHRSILCFHSPVLKKAFYSTDVPATTYTINEINPEGFKILLRYLYTSEIPVKVTSDDLVEACYAAQILQMMEIGEKLIQNVLWRPRPGKKFSGKTVAEVQFWPLLEKCRSLRFGSFQEKLLKFAESNFKSVFDSEVFVLADMKTIKLMFDRKCHSVPQMKVLESIARWVEANDHLVFSDQYVRELLNCVDFKRLSPKEFYAVASKYDRLLSKKDSLDILMHLIDSTVCLLPEWYQLDDKEWNIPANRETESKIDKFKSMDDILNNLSSTASVSRKKDFQSAEDLRKPAKVKNSEKRKGKKSLASLKGITLQDSFYQMLKEGLFTDVTLIAKDNTKIPAHGLVLAAGSEFFADAFYNKAPASKTLCMEETVEEVKDILRYFYGCGTESVFGRSLDYILRKTHMAVKYRCYPLMKVCEDALSWMTLDPVAFWTFSGWVDRVSHPKVNSESLMRYAATSTKEIFEHDSFLKASKDSLVRALENDYLNMAEVDILGYVARWMEKNSNQVPTEISKKKLLGNIRFESLDSEQFFAFLKKHEGIFPIRDSFAVLQFLFQKSEENCLPEWCYRGPLRSIFYHPSTKIGTNVPVPWSGSPEKGKNRFCSIYTVSIRDKRPNSEIQFLELSFNFKAPIHKKCTPACSCNVSIKTEDRGFPKIFENLKMSNQQRYLLPVCFRLDASYNRSFKLIITVDAKHSHKFYSVNKQALEFDNVAFLPTSGEINCLCDAIVDGFTSENVPVPPHLLSENRNEVVATEKYFKITPKQKT